MKKSALWLAILFIIVSIFVGCSSRDTDSLGTDKTTLKYGKAAGPYTVLLEDAVKPILEKQGYKLEVVEFSDLLQNDAALNEGEIDFNVEQHTAYAENFNANQNGNLVSITPIPTVKNSGSIFF